MLGVVEENLVSDIQDGPIPRPETQDNSEHPPGSPGPPLPITIEEEEEEEETMFTQEMIEREASRQVEEEEGGSDDESEEERGEALPP